MHGSTLANENDWKFWTHWLLLLVAGDLWLARFASSPPRAPLLQGMHINIMDDHDDCSDKQASLASLVCSTGVAWFAALANCRRRGVWSLARGAWSCERGWEISGEHFLLYFTVLLTPTFKNTR